jgi:Family of unknown function (DUF6326)
MISNEKSSKNQVDKRIILSVLWAARALSGLQGDSTRFHDPVALNELVSGTSDVPVSNSLLLIMSIIMAIPIVMSFLSLILKEKANRWTNRCFGIFFVIFDLLFLVLALFLWPFSAYETFWSIAYLAFTSIVLLYAWKWRKNE